MLKIMEKYEDTDFGDCAEYDIIIENLAKSKESLKEAIAKGKELRQAFLAEKAEVAHLNGNLSAEAAIKQIAHIEAIISVFNSLKRVMRKNSPSGSLTRIKIRKENGSYSTVTDQRK